MTASSLSLSSLVAYDAAAAGHDGILLDPTGDLIIKPCTAAEVSFYEASVSAHPEFAELMPTFMGTLSLGVAETPVSKATLPADQTSALPLPNAVLINPIPDDRNPSLEFIKGKKIDSETSIVLENIASPFTKPCILDVKLGARLWDDAVKPEKRAKLDLLAAETTSKSLGFRIAGMRVWRAHEKDFKVYDKLYGRQLTEENVLEGFKAFLGRERGPTNMPVSASLDDAELAALARGLADRVTEIRNVYEKEEIRAYSASLLFVYEGDPVAFRKTLDAATLYRNTPDGVSPDEQSDLNSGEDEEESDEDGAPPRVFDIRLIDFAHATWRPGQGPDENVLHGMRNLEKTLRELVSLLEGADGS
ncbi:hypothetical protein LTR66_000735 [Elasticomyces elasticus]|nr:hypothetical protein LTR66_000735 [Elasticomyces elasticus]